MRYLGFVNLTPFAAQPLLLSDERGADQLTFAVKATFALGGHSEITTLTIADEQLPVCLAPVHYGDPGKTSIKFESETAPSKRGTDVALIGHAHATGGPATYLDVSLSVGPARGVVRVFGDRVWTFAGRWVASAPQPFERIPLIYERAFGGWDRSSPDPSHHQYEPRNPVGVGFLSARHTTSIEGTHLPNLENPYQPISSPTDRPSPAGFGFVGHDWEPRRSLAGTYDARWEKDRMPLLPNDFDPRFYSAAHPTLALRGYLRGGESVEVTNASTVGTLRFALPRHQPFATVRMKDGATHRVALALDTVIIDTDENRLLVLWRGSMSVHRAIHKVLWSKTQLVTSAIAR